MTELFRVDGLRARPSTEQGATATDEILAGLDIVVHAGELHAITGDERSGVGALGPILLGAPGYAVTGGSIRFQGDDITDWPTDERAKAGMFLGAHDPHRIEGVTLIQLLRQAMTARHGSESSVAELQAAAIEWATRLGADPSLVDATPGHDAPADRRLHYEIVQLAILRPALAILDRVDASAGLDCLREVRAAQPDLGLVLIGTARQHLREIRPDRVHVMAGGRIVRSGGCDLIEQRAVMSGGSAPVTVTA